MYKQGQLSPFPLSLLLTMIILIEGFVSIATEILTIRQLLPVAGGSVIVTSLIIGIFLLFLALGYHRGGQFRTHPQKDLQLNFLIAAVWLGIGLSYFFVGLFFKIVEHYTGYHIIYALLLYLLLVIAPLIFILGQTVPITMNMVKQNQSAGSIGGQTLSLSTIGSFLGATVTTLILMHYLGVAWTLTINVGLLLSLYLLLSFKEPSFFIAIFISAFVMSIIYFFNINVEKNIFSRTNNYANYQILDINHADIAQKILMINDAASSAIDKNNKGFFYIELIKKILFHEMKIHDADILVLGAGGFSLSNAGTYGNHFTYVDIDPQIKEVVFPAFSTNLNGELIIADARQYLKNANHLYQVIVTDAYTDVKSIPAHLLTLEFMNDIFNHLTNNGIAIFNVIAKPTLSDHYSKRIDNTLRAVFQNCMAIPQVFADRATNIIYVCSKNKSTKDNKIYSDNLNNSTTDSFNW